MGGRERRTPSVRPRNRRRWRRRHDPARFPRLLRRRIARGNLLGRLVPVLRRKWLGAALPGNYRRRSEEQLQQTDRTRNRGRAPAQPARSSRVADAVTRNAWTFREHTQTLHPCSSPYNTCTERRRYARTSRWDSRPNQYETQAIHSSGLAPCDHVTSAWFEVSYFNPARYRNDAGSQTEEHDSPGKSEVEYAHALHA